MRILLVNDDGIESTGLSVLAREVIRRGHTLTVVAPLHQQSAASHRITLSQPLMLTQKNWPDADAYALDGSPADCVRLALSNLVSEPVDFCLSGINDGFNAGAATYYSGTVSAAREASMLGVRAMAVSCDFGASTEALEYTARLALSLAERAVKAPFHPLWLMNLNVPNAPERADRPLTIAPLSRAFYRDSYIERKSPFGRTYFWLSDEPALDAPEMGSDTALLHEGYPTCTYMGGFVEKNECVAAILQD